MKIKILSVVLFFVVLIPINAQVDRSIMPKAGPAPEIKIGDIESFTLDNGLKVYVVENHKLPKVTFRLLIDRDPILEGDNAGYIDFSGELIRTGTKTRTKDQIDEAVDFIGASLFTSGTSVTASALTKHMDALLDLMSDVTLNSEFKQEELDKLKKQRISGLAAEKDDPGAIAGNVRRVLNFGKDHPYGEIVTEETIENISLETCTNYYKTYFKPNIAYLAIVGDISLDIAKQKVAKYFGSWQKGEIPNFKYKTPRTPLVTKVGIVDRPNAVQSTIHVTYPVKLKKNSPDVIAATVMNNIFGGSFSSRINQNLREDKGYTYGARSSINSDELIGSFDASLEARNSVTDSSITELLAEMKKLRKEPVPDDELDAIKKYMMGSFSRSLENPQTIASFAINIDRYNLPKDFYKNYLKNVEAVSSKDIQKMAKKYLQPKRAYIFAVGKADDIAETLKKFTLSGKVTYYDIYGEKYDPSIKNLPAELTADKIMENYISALGGKENILKVNDKTTTLSGSVQGMNISLTISQKAPNKYYQFMDAGVFQQKTVFDGTTGYSEAMGKSQELEGNQLEAMKVQANLHAYLDYKSLGIDPQLIGTEKVGGKEAYKLNLYTPWGNVWTQYYSVETGLLVKQVTPVTTPQGSFKQAIEFGDYKDVEGVKYPFKLIQQMGPQAIELKVESVKINSGLDDSLFDVN